jgi:hypothetical protein
MSGPADNPTPPDAGVRNYTFLCLVALLVTLLGLTMALPWRPVWLLVPVIVGLGGLLLRWRWAPLLFLATLGGVLCFESILRASYRGRPAPGPSPAVDLLLGAAALAYVAGHYRLQGLVRAVFPHDPRRPAAPRRTDRPAGPRRPPAQVPARRSPGLAAPGELVWFLLALPTWALLALLAFRLLLPGGTPDPLDDPRRFAGGDWSDVGDVLMSLALLVWRGRLLLWVLGFGSLLAAGLIGYLGWARASRAEAAVFLADTVWRETRRETRLLLAWRVWERWRRGRGKDQP